MVNGRPCKCACHIAINPILFLFARVSPDSRNKNPGIKPTPFGTIFHRLLGIRDSIHIGKTPQCADHRGHRRRQALGKVDIQLTLDSSCKACALVISACVGFRYKAPLKPSKYTACADRYPKIASPAATIAGIPIARAMIAVRSRSALSGDKAQNHIGIQVRGIGRREIIGHEYGRLLPLQSSPARYPCATTGVNPGCATSLKSMARTANTASSSLVICAIRQVNHMPPAQAACVFARLRLWLPLSSSSSLQKLCVREEKSPLVLNRGDFSPLDNYLQGLMGIHHRRIKGNQFGSRIGLLILDHNFFRGVLSDRAAHYAIGGRHATGKRGRFRLSQQTLAIQHHRRCFSCSSPSPKPLSIAV